MPTTTTEAIPDYRANHPAMRALRASMRLIGTLSPRLAGRVAYEFYHTPRATRAPERELHVLAKARSLSIPFGRSALAGYEWGAGDRSVLLMHGWEGRAGQLGAFVEPLIARGFRVLAFDGPAHGRSPGRRTDTEQFAAALHETEKRFGPIHAAIAHSMGAASVMYAHRHGFGIARAVFIAPMAISSEPFRKFVAIVGIRPAVERDLRRRLEEAYGADVWSRFELSNLVGTPKASLLVVHDREDRDVSIREGEALVAAWPKAELAVTSGLGHRRILRDAQVVQRAVDFIATQPTVDERRALRS